MSRSLQRRWHPRRTGVGPRRQPASRRSLTTLSRCTRRCSRCSRGTSCMPSSPRRVPCVGTRSGQHAHAHATVRTFKTRARAFAGPGFLRRWFVGVVPRSRLWACFYSAMHRARRPLCPHRGRQVAPRAERLSGARKIRAGADLAMSSAGIDIVAQMAPSSYATERPDGVRVCSPGAHTQGERGITSYIVLSRFVFYTIIVYGSA